jgi:predicted dehydrogenase
VIKVDQNGERTEENTLSSVGIFVDADGKYHYRDLEDNDEDKDNEKTTEEWILLFSATMSEEAFHESDLSSLKISEVTGITGNQIHKYPDTEDAGTGIFKMDNGAIFTVEANFNLSDELGGCKFEIYGTEGTIVAEGTLGQVETGEVRYKLKSELERGWQTLSYESGNMYTKETSLFAEAILSGSPVPVPASEAILDQKVVEAVYESYESKKHIIM